MCVCACVSVFWKGEGLHNINVNNRIAKTLKLKRSHFSGRIWAKVHIPQRTPPKIVAKVLEWFNIRL